MPSPLQARHKLHQRAVAPDIKVGRNSQAGNLRKVGMSVRLQLVGEQALHLVAPIDAWWQADTMNHQKINYRRRARIEIGGWHKYSIGQNPILVNFHEIIQR